MADVISGNDGDPQLTHEEAIHTYFDVLRTVEVGGLLMAQVLIDPVLFPSAPEGETGTDRVLKQLDRYNDPTVDKAMEDWTLRRVCVGSVVKVLAGVATRDFVPFERISVVTADAVGTIAEIESDGRLSTEHRRTLLATFKGMAASRTNCEDPRTERAQEIVRNIPRSRLASRVAEYFGKITPEAMTQLPRL